MYFKLYLELYFVVLIVKCEVQREVYHINGYLKGVLHSSRKGKQFLGFHGIPYAMAPIGSLRFKEPQIFSHPWPDVKKAYYDGDVCLQWSSKENKVIGNEDCLYLNVYTHQVPETIGQHNLPVMVWIHGGLWSSGGGTSNLYPPNFLMDHNIVLVTFNYRLGALGFLSMGDTDMPANLGLKDQVAALIWIQENIMYFGGDRESVTLFGQDAGGASVHYHMLSPLSKGLFQRAISQSGSILCPWAYPQNDDSNAYKLASLLGCSSMRNSSLIACMQEVDGEVIVAAERKLMEFLHTEEHVLFGPVVEKTQHRSFISHDPLQFLHDDSIRLKIPWIIGITSDEGGNRAAGVCKDEKWWLDKLDKEFEKVALISSHDTLSVADIDIITKKMKDLYIGNRTLSNNCVSILTDLYTDAFFFHNIDESVRLHSLISSQPIYYYIFSYKGPSTFCTSPRELRYDFGVCHGDELQYLFPLDVSLQNFMTGEDEKVIDIMTQLWTDFASTGNPNSGNKFIVEWENVASHEVEYLNISLQIKTGYGLWHHRSQFWSSLPLQKEIAPSRPFRDEL